MALANEDERRRHVRMPVENTKATICFSSNTADTVLRDISAGGARIVSPEVGLPSCFQIALPGGALVLNAERCWEKDGEMGIRFLYG